MAYLLRATQMLAKEPVDSHNLSRGRFRELVRRLGSAGRQLQLQRARQRATSELRFLIREEAFLFGRKGPHSD